MSSTGVPSTVLTLRNRNYIVAPSQLCDIEKKGATPNLYRLHALSFAYDCEIGNC
jgi:hypothetical protein